MNFSFYSAGEIIFGRGEFNRSGELVKAHGNKALVVLRGQAMRRFGIYDRLVEQLRTAGVEYVTYNCPSAEPEVADIDNGAQVARTAQVDVIIAVGGGSTLDTGKAISALATNDGSVANYLEGVGQGWTLLHPPLPFIAVPTTAGTGTEVTKNAVISSRLKKFKKSIRSPLMIPKVALLDPELTISLPAQQTAECGMDALTQLIEAYVCKKAQPITDALAVYGIGLVGKYLVRAAKNGTDIEAREGMLLASLLSGLCLANAGLGAAHGIAAALGAVLGVPHGLACAVVLPAVMEVNIATNPSKFAEIGRALTAAQIVDAEEAAAKAIGFIKALNARIGIPTKLTNYPLTPSCVPELVAASFGSSMNGNPKNLTDAEIEKLIVPLFD